MACPTVGVTYLEDGCAQEQQAPRGLTPSHSGVRGGTSDAVVPLFDRNPFVGADGGTDGPARAESTGTGEQPGTRPSESLMPHGHKTRQHLCDCHAAWVPAVDLRHVAVLTKQSLCDLTLLVPVSRAGRSR